LKRTVDWSLYCVTDRVLAAGRPLDEIVRAAVRGGATVVQLREKECSTRKFVELAKKIKTILEPGGVPLIINDRVDVALAAEADGVHVGQSDMKYEDARSLMGDDALVGLSVETMEQAKEASDLGADYLGVSPIFPTPTKTDTVAEWGIEGLRDLRRISRHVLVAIGGINADNAARVVEAGADGIAVVSALCAAPDPEAAARELREIVEQIRMTRRGQ